MGEFSVALSLNRKDLDSALLKARAYLLHAEVDRANEIMAEFIDIPEVENEMKVQYGNYAINVGKVAEAIEAFKSSLLFSKSEATYRKLLISYIFSKNLIYAEDSLEKLNEKFPSEFYEYDLKCIKALKMSTINEFKEARQILKELDDEIEGGFIFKKSD